MPSSDQTSVVYSLQLLDRKKLKFAFLFVGRETSGYLLYIKTESRLQRATDSVRQTEQMFVGSKSASGAGVAGRVCTSRQTDFDNERQNKQVASNKHVPASQTNALKCQTERLYGETNMLSPVVVVFGFFPLCVLARISLPVVVAFHNFSPCKSCCCDEWVKLCHSQDSLHCFLFLGIYGGASMLLFFQYTEGTRGKVEVFKPTPLPATPLIFSKRTLPLLGVRVPPPPPHPHFQSTRCL